MCGCGQAGLSANYIAAREFDGWPVVLCDDDIERYPGAAMLFQRAQKFFERGIVQTAFGMQVMLDRMQIADVALLYDDMFVYPDIGKLEMQQAPSAQHGQRVEAAAKRGAFVVGVRS